MFEYNIEVLRKYKVDRFTQLCIDDDIIIMKIENYKENEKERNKLEKFLNYLHEDFIKHRYYFYIESDNILYLIKNEYIDNKDNIDIKEIIKNNDLEDYRVFNYMQYFRNNQKEKGIYDITLYIKKRDNDYGIYLNTNTLFTFAMERYYVITYNL